MGGLNQGSLIGNGIDGVSCRRYEQGNGDKGNVRIEGDNK